MRHPTPRRPLVLALALALAAALVAGCAAAEEPVVAPAGSGAAAGAGTTGTSSAAVAAGASSGSAAAPAADAKVGDEMRLKGTAYTVLDARTARSVGEEPLAVEADGRFVIVRLSLENLKDEPATILDDAIRLVGANGKEYTTSTDALMAVEDAFIVQEIQPEVVKKVTLVYDVPPKAIGPGAVLQVKDIWSDSTGTIALGLKAPK